MKQEYPKCLTKGDEARIVMDTDQEEAARADGFTFHADAPKEPEQKRRVKKGEA